MKYLEEKTGRCGSGATQSRWVEMLQVKEVRLRCFPSCLRGGHQRESLAANTGWSQYGRLLCMQSGLSNINTCFRIGGIRIPEVLFDAAAPAEIHLADNLEKGKGGFEGLFRVPASKIDSPAMYNLVFFPK